MTSGVLIPTEASLGKTSQRIFFHNFQVKMQGFMHFYWEKLLVVRVPQGIFFSNFKLKCGVCAFYCEKKSTCG